MRTKVELCTVVDPGAKTKRTANSAEKGLAVSSAVLWMHCGGPEECRGRQLRLSTVERHGRTPPIPSERQRLVGWWRGGRSMPANGVSKK